MSTLRISNIEAKADASSPTVNEKLKFTSSPSAGQDPLLHLDGLHAASGITTIGINTTGNTITVKGNDVNFAGILTATKFGPINGVTDLELNAAADSNKVKIQKNLEINTVGYHGVNNPTNEQVIIKSTYNNSVAACNVTFYKQSANPADGHYISELIFKGRNDNNQDVEYANIYSQMVDVSDGDEGGEIKISTMKNGTSTATAVFAEGTNTFFGGITASGTSASTFGGDVNVSKGVITTGVTTSSTYDLSAISKTISQTAVDVFVYDTRKDSDGGAWRKRTQDTSWYNETLGTSTRGTRREFPAVAVIVASNSNVFIYDGDDPEMPLWMKFDQYGAVSLASNMITLYSNTIHRVKALNGILLVGMTAPSQNEGMFEINFITDRGRVYRTEGSGVTGGYYTKGIGERNSQTGYHEGDFNETALISQNILAIDMTVLPNAPIDKDTGLPRPTYAVGTDNGATILRGDNVSWVQYYNSSSAYRNADLIQFTEDGGFIYGQTHDNGAEQWMYKYDSLRSRDASSAYHGDGGDLHLMPRIWDSGHATTGVELYYNDNVNQSSGRGRRLANNGKILATYYGLTYIDDKPGDHARGMVAYTSADYHTGWMCGDIKLATLADTSTTAPANLVTNGTFDSGTGWTLSDAAAPTVSGGKLVFDGTSGTGLAQQAVSPAVLNRYETYDLTFTVTRTAGTVQARIGNSSYTPAVSSSGTYTYSIECKNVPTETVLFYGNSFNGTVDDVSVKRNIQDYSKGIVGSKKGITTYGTITKTAVATGADLVAYSGFTTTNHLEQDDNHQFTNGDFCFMFWVNLTAAGNNNQTFIDMSSSDGGVGNPRMRIHQMTSPTGSVRLYTDSANVVSTSNIIGRGWTFITGIRRISNKGMEIYINGVLEKRGAGGSTNFNTASGQLSIGLDGDGTDPLDNGSITLVRSSATAPTPEQVSKIYHDEKVLFAPNAKCTIYGTSSDVNAVAYDDGTGILHAGTGQGRSEFNGFVRINNTTDAISTAVSASNGLVVEE